MENPSAPLKLAFMGGGLNSSVGGAHRAALRMDGLFTLEAGCFSRSQETNALSADKFGVKRFYPDIDALIALEKGTVDAVAVLLPIPCHKEAVLKLLDAGIPVICEKSLCMNLQEAENIAEYVHKTGTYLTVTYNYTGYPLVRELKSIIAADFLGKILHFDIEMPQESFLRRSRPPKGWRIQNFSPSLLSLDLLTHVHNLAQYLIGGKIREVLAVQNRFAGSPAADDLRVTACYESGVQGNFYVSKTCAGFRNGLKARIFGTKAAALWHQEYPEEIWILEEEGKRVIDRASPLFIAREERYRRFKAGHPAGYIEAFANLYGDIASRLRGGEKKLELTEIDEEVERMRFLEAAEESAMKGTWEIV